MNAIRRGWDRYLSALNAGAFSIDESGATVFFPSGVFGRGYVVSAAQEAAIRRFLSRMYLGVFVVTIVGVQIFRLATLLLIPPVLLLYWLWSRRVVAGLPDSPMRMTVREADRRTSQLFGRRGLIALLALTILMTAASLAMLLTPTYELAGALGVLLFGFGTYRFASILARSRGGPPA